VLRRNNIFIYLLIIITTLWSTVWHICRNFWKLKKKFLALRFLCNFISSSILKRWIWIWSKNFKFNNSLLRMATQSPTNFWFVWYVLQQKILFICIYTRCIKTWFDSKVFEIADFESKAKNYQIQNCGLKMVSSNTKCTRISLKTYAWLVINH